MVPGNEASRNLSPLSSLRIVYSMSKSSQEHNSVHCTLNHTWDC